MAKLSVRDLDLQGKRVLIRVDFNVPREGRQGRRRPPHPGGAADDPAHPREGGKAVLDEPPRPARRQAEREVLAQARRAAGSGAARQAGRLRRGPRAACVDAAREPPLPQGRGEERRRLGQASSPKLGDVYVNDAFGTAHREHARTFGVPQVLQGKPRRRLPDREGAQVPRQGADEPRQRPFVAILGGARSPTRSTSSSSSLEKADTLLIGGGDGLHLLKAQGKEVGRARGRDGQARPREEDPAREGRGIDRCPSTTSSPTRSTRRRRRRSSTATSPTAGRLRHRPEAVELFKQEIAKAKTIIWNGPMGVFEKEPFAAGTKAVAAAPSRRLQGRTTHHRRRRHRGGGRADRPGRQGQPRLAPAAARRWSSWRERSFSAIAAS